MGGGVGKPTLLKVVPHPRSGWVIPPSQQDGGSPISESGYPPPTGWATPVQVPDQDGGEGGTPNSDSIACTCYIGLIFSFFFSNLLWALVLLGGKGWWTFCAVCTGLGWFYTFVVSKLLTMLSKINMATLDSALSIQPCGCSSPKQIIR